MSKKRRNRHKTEHKEAQFDFDEAKELTVGEAMRKNEEVEAGVLPGDSILDKYVKQHKDEIEADKFVTRQYKPFSSGTRRVRKEKQKRLCFNRFGACISNYLCQRLLCLSSSSSFDQGNPDFSINYEHAVRCRRIQ